MKDKQQPTTDNVSLLVQHDEAERMLPLEKDKLDELNKKAQDYIDATVSLTANSPEFYSQISMIHTLANSTIRESAQCANHLLNQPLASCQDSINNEVSTSLIQLRTLIEDLDPDLHNIFAPKKLFGIIPWSNKAYDYFLRYQNAQHHLNVIIEKLLKSKDSLLRDNAAIEQERSRLWGLMLVLRQYAVLGKYLDEALCNLLPEISNKDKQKADLLKKQLLFYLRQKQTDILTQLAVSMQGYLALDIIHKNNLELMKGVDRATTSTISALQTAVITAQALGRQKLVLDQINALNETTGKLIAQTSRMMNEQAGQIQKGASSANIELEQLKSAFVSVYSALDNLDKYKTEALDSMAETITLLRTESEIAEKHLKTFRTRTENNTISTEERNNSNLKIDT